MSDCRAELFFGVLALVVSPIVAGAIIVAVLDWLMETLWP